MFIAKMLKVLLHLLIVAASVASVGNARQNNDDIGEETQPAQHVEMIKQNYKEEINKLLVAQIRTELEASYIYQAYASYFQRADVDLPGIKEFFTKASAEEKEHAQMLIDYVNKRGGHAQFDELDLLATCSAVKKDFKSYRHGSTKTRMCICSFVATKKINEKCEDRSSWKNGLYAFEDALALERYVNSQLLELHEKADEAGDAHLSHMLEHNFLEEQIDSINQLGHFITRLESFKGETYSLGEYTFDQKLK